MQWDLGIQGIGLLIVLSLAFGLFTQALFWNRASLWLGVIAAGVSFVGGILISEGLFGWATAKDLQPNIDGLSFDEVVLGFLAGVVIVLVARYVTRSAGTPLGGTGRGGHQPMAS
jgi:hypothetical protein